MELKFPLNGSQIDVKAKIKDWARRHGHKPNVKECTAVKQRYICNSRGRCAWTTTVYPNQHNEWRISYASTNLVAHPKDNSLFSQKKTKSGRIGTATEGSAAVQTATTIEEPSGTTSRHDEPLTGICQYSLPIDDSTREMHARWEEAKDRVRNTFEQMKAADEVSHHIKHLYATRPLCFPEPVILPDGCTLADAIKLVEDDFAYSRLQQSILPAVVISTEATKASLLSSRSPLKEKCIFWITFSRNTMAHRVRALNALSAALESSTEGWQMQSPRGVGTISVGVSALRERFRRWFDPTTETTPMSPTLRSIFHDTLSSADTVTEEFLRCYDAKKAALRNLEATKALNASSASIALAATEVLMKTDPEKRGLKRAAKRNSRSRRPAMQPRTRKELLSLFHNHMLHFPWNFLAPEGIGQYFDDIGDSMEFLKAQSIRMMDPILELLDKRNFTLVAEKLSCSGLHLDLLNGTWIRVLHGAKAWLICDLGCVENSCYFDDLKETRPMSMGQMFCIPLVEGTNGDMRSGHLCGHAVIGLEDTICNGGHYIDGHMLPSVLKNWLKIFGNPAVTNEHIPNGATKALETIRAIAEDPSLLGEHEEVEEALTKLESLLNDFIVCRCASGSCGQGCFCSEVEGSDVKLPGCTSRCPCGGACRQFHLSSKQI